MLAIAPRLWTLVPKARRAVPDLERDRRPVLCERAHHRRRSLRPQRHPPAILVVEVVHLLAHDVGRLADPLEHRQLFKSWADEQAIAGALDAPRRTRRRVTPTGPTRAEGRREFPSARGTPSEEAPREATVVAPVSRWNCRYGRMRGWGTRVVVLSVALALGSSACETPPPSVEPSVSRKRRTVRSSRPTATGTPTSHAYRSDSRSGTWVTSAGAGSSLHADFGSGDVGRWADRHPLRDGPGQPAAGADHLRVRRRERPGPVPDTCRTRPSRAARRATATATCSSSTATTASCTRPSPPTRNGNGTWHAGSGAIWNLNSNALRPQTWTSADAAGLPILPGLVRYDEIASGSIDHAIRITLNRTDRRYVWPATHQAGDGNANNAPMGARFRLKASFDDQQLPGDGTGDPARAQEVRRHRGRQRQLVVHLRRSRSELGQRRAARRCVTSRARTSSSSTRRRS